MNTVSPRRPTGPLPPGREWDYSAFRVRVRAITRPSPSFVRVTLAGDCLARFAPWGLDQRIKLVLPAPAQDLEEGQDPFSAVAACGLFEEPTPHPSRWYARYRELPERGRSVLRSYTPAAIRPAQGELDVDLFVHEPAGPATRWALAARVGDEIVVNGPDLRSGPTGYGIHFTPQAGARRHLLLGDETALPAIGGILASLPGDQEATVLLEVGLAADALLPEVRAAVATEVVLRRGAPGAALEDAVVRWADGARVDPELYVWIAGEAGSIARLRRHLAGSAGVPKDQIAFMGYWRTGGPLAG